MTMPFAMEEFQQAESDYRMTLSRLAYTALSHPQHIRRLVAHHQAFLRVQEHSELVQWLERGIAIYAQYIASYHIDAETSDSDVTLRKAPMVRVNQLSKLCAALGVSGGALYSKYKKLAQQAMNRVEETNKEVDLVTLRFNDVRDIHTLGKTVSYFKLDDIIRRDYFYFSMTHPLETFESDVLVEVFLLANNAIAVTKVLSVGRSLMFPPLKVCDFLVKQNDLDCISMSADEITLSFKCPDEEQMDEWNHLVDHLPIDSAFDESHEKLRPLKNGKVGLGLKFESQSQLRRSTPIVSRHESLIRSSVLSDNSVKLNLDLYFTKDADLTNINKRTDAPPLKSPLLKTNTPQLKSLGTPHLETSSFEESSASFETDLSPEVSVKPSVLKRSSLCNNLNESIVSLPAFGQASTEKTKPFTSTIDLTSQKPVEKKKRRKSIFGLFSKKEKEPSFEICTEPITPQRQILSDVESQTKTLPKKESMASLQRSVNQLSLSSESKKPSLPSPFAVNTTTKNPLTELEKSILQDSTLFATITNSCIVSRWHNSKWEQLGNGYNTELKFFKHADNDSLAIYTQPCSDEPFKLVPLSGASLSKSSARDLQLQCHQGFLDQRRTIYTLRCVDSRTVSLIVDELQRMRGCNESLSAASSTSVIFDKPSTSTSMSSLEDCKSLEPPSTAKTTLYQQESVSTLSVGSQDASTFDKNELLLLSQKVRLHKQDQDGDWIPVSMGKFSLLSHVRDPSYSKFQVSCTNGTQLNALVLNQKCQRLGKSGIQFTCETATKQEPVSYLLEFKGSKQCSQALELLSS